MIKDFFICRHLFWLSFSKTRKRMEMGIIEIKNHSLILQHFC
ncbi:hypothetical protein B4096_0196 [Heyndrickxia coagulans]|nr:hypothetical protein B4096_0196 [Heyndrickxia coagulans]